MASKRNSEGYFDPTAYEALTKIEREAKTHAFRPMVYICSPLSGSIAANQRSARRYCRFAVDGGYIPLAPHLYFPQLWMTATWPSGTSPCSWILCCPRIMGLTCLSDCNRREGSER